MIYVQEGIERHIPIRLPTDHIRQILQIVVDHVVVSDVSLRGHEQVTETPTLSEPVPVGEGGQAFQERVIDEGPGVTAMFLHA